jgi:Zn-dependent protease with chaperone function
MLAGPDGLLALPVVAWVLVGVGILWGFHRSASPVAVLRLSALFLALWSLIATTIAVWLLSNGGWEAVVRLARAPASFLLLFDLGDARVWVEGAFGAFAVFLAAFLLNQLAARGRLAFLDARPLAWPSSLPIPTAPTTLLAGRTDRAEAFSFTLLELRGLHRRPRGRDVIVVSDRLLGILDPEELEAVIAHELGHLERLDGRYLTFLRTLSRLMRWDPVLAHTSRALTRREEYYADERASRLTGRPLTLARALLKLSSPGPRARPSSRVAPSLAGGSRSDREASVRIRRLLAMAEARARAEARGA